MEKKLFLLILIFLFTACEKFVVKLPEITEHDLRQEKEIKDLLREEIYKGEIVELLENPPSELNQKGLITNLLLDKIISKIMPKHLLEFDKNHQGLSQKKEAFAQYKGVYGRCHQFRIFYPYRDSRLEGVAWASSILSTPALNASKTQAGVVLAPTLDGFTPFIENGLWLKLCRKGLATLMPESLFRKNESGWEKIHFDPTPKYKSVNEFNLYEESIRRYEVVLNRNIELMRNLNNLKTDQDWLISDLNIMKVDPDRVGLWGSSFGAVVGALVVAKDPRIKGAVLTVGGGNLPYIISHSKIDLFKTTRTEQMKLLGLKNLTDYQTFISHYIQSDPLHYAKKSDSSRIYMILASKDTSVPAKGQFELYKKFGEPSNTRLNSGHVLALLFISWFDSGPSNRAINTLVNKLEKDEN